MKETQNIENILSDILDEYSRGEILAECLDKTRKNYNEELHNIIEGYALDKKNEKIKKYAALKIKQHINDKNTHGSRRYDWEILSDKDYSADLLNYVADYILSNDEFSRALSIKNILKQVTENVKKYYEEEFEEKIEESKNYYQQYGNFDYYEA